MAEAEVREPYVLQRGLTEERFTQSYEAKFDTLEEAITAFEKVVKEVGHADWRVAKWDPIKREYEVYKYHNAVPRGVGRPKQIH